MIGLGLDVVEVDRFRRAITRRASLQQRLFTNAELADVEVSRDPVPRLAARFAAKEAVMKALGVGIGAVRWHDIEVRRDSDSGKPSLVVHGLAAERAATLGVTGWQLSLTHTRSAAAAVVVAL